MKRISRTELKEKLDRQQDLRLVFVLGEWQYQAMHIPGSLHVPHSLSLYQSGEALAGLDRDDEIVVYCSNDICYASISAYYLLVQRGFKNVRRYAGGLLDWHEAGYPLRRGDGRSVSGRKVITGVRPAPVPVPGANPPGASPPR
jgi:rhodanese-related sulfurtransferase